MFLSFPRTHVTLALARKARVRLLLLSVFPYLPGGSSIAGLSVEAPSPEPGRLLASSLELAVDKGEAPFSCFILGCTGLLGVAVLAQCNIASLSKAFTSSACGE
jgi:hypothetical protein